MAINPKRVLLILNSNTDAINNPTMASLSKQAADWYASARGLLTGTEYFFLAFDFGNCTIKNTMVTERVYPTLPNGDPPLESTFGNIAIDSLVLQAKSPTLITNVTPGVTVLKDAIKSVIDTYKIQLLLVTPGIPPALQGPFANGGTQYAQPIEIWLAQLQRLAPLAAAARLIANNSCVASVKPYQFAKDPAVEMAYPMSPNYIGASGIPYGRIGWVDFTEPYTFSPLGDPNTPGTIQYIVTNAIAAEKTDNRMQPHLVGGTSYVTDGDGPHCTTANLLAWISGCKNLYFNPTQIRGCCGTRIANSLGTNAPLTATLTRDAHQGDKFIYTTVPVGGDGYWASVTMAGISPYTWSISNKQAGANSAELMYELNFQQLGLDNFDAPYAAGALVAPAGTAVAINKWAYPAPADGPKSWFGLCYSEGSQVASDYVNGGPVSAYTKFLPGAWAFCWQSSAHMMGRLCLRTGGSLAFCNFDEPFSTNIARVDSVMGALLHGYCGAEVIYRCQANALSAWGDPMYAPYARSADQKFEVFRTV